MPTEVSLLGTSETIKQLSSIGLKTSAGEEIRLRDWSGESLGAAAVIAEDEAEPLKVAKLLHRTDKSAPILIISDSDHAQQIKQNLLTTPNIGLDTHVVLNQDIKELAQELVRHVELGLKRRRHRQRVFGAHQNLATSGSYKPPTPLFLNHLLDKLPIGVMTIGLDQKLINLNPAATMLLDAKPKQALGKPLGEWLTPRNAAQTASLISEVLQTGKTAECTLEYQRGNRDTHLRFICNRADPDSPESGALVLIQDVTAEIIADRRRDQYEALLARTNQELEARVEERTEELLQTQENLKQRNRQLQRSNEDLEKFSFIAAHDLSEPLRKISVFADLLDSKSRGALDDEARNYLSSMQRSSRHLRQLIEALLSYSRINSAELSLRPTDLGKVVDNVSKELELTLQETGGHIVADNLPTIAVDPVLIQQVLQNLICNSLRYRRPDVEPVISISASFDNAQQVCEILISDNGVGFDPAYRDRIFQPFERLANKAGEKGCGIGLAICHQICTRHGGSISADGRPDEGAEFLICLPLNQSN